MMLRARHLLFAWLTYGALQLALLGIPGASRQLTVGSRESRTQTTSQSITLGKRLTDGGRGPQLNGRSGGA